MASLPSDSLDCPPSGGTVLVFDSPFEPPARRACPSLCRSSESGAQDVLSVLITVSPSGYVRSWERTAGDRPDRIRIIDVDPGQPSSARADSSQVVERVGSPGDLTTLGVAITTALSQWDGDSNGIAVCFDSVTPLLQYADLDRVRRFLRELTARFDAVDATAHVHVDPKAHDAGTMGALVPLFDDVVEADGSPTCCSAD